MRIVFMGTPDFAVPSLRALADAGYAVAGVFTQPDRPKGRGGRVQMSPVKELALSLGIPVFQPLKIRRDGLADLEALAPDLCVTAAFGQILSQEVLDIPSLGTVNVHASLLPRHRGSAPIPWAILSGDTMTGVTTMLTDKGIDTGDMLLRAETPIADTDTAATLTARLSDIGAALLLDTIARLAAGDCPRAKQDEAAMTYDPKLTKEMGELTLHETTRRCLLRVRAMDPWPSAYLNAANGALKVWQAAEYPAKADRPGTVLFADQQHGLVVSTLDGALELLSVQAPNARRMEARAYLRGHLIEAGKPLDEVMI